MARSERRCENDHPELAGPRSPTLVAQCPRTGKDIREWRAEPKATHVDGWALGIGLLGVMFMLEPVVLLHIWPVKTPGYMGGGVIVSFITGLGCLEFGVAGSGILLWLDSRRFVTADPQCLGLRRRLSCRAIPWQQIQGAEFGRRRGWVILDGSRRVALPIAGLNSDQLEDMVTFITERAHLAKIEEADEVLIYGRVRLRRPGALPEIGGGSPLDPAAGILPTRVRRPGDPGPDPRADSAE